MIFLLSEKAEKGQFSVSHQPLWFTLKWLKFCTEPPGGTLHLEKRKKELGNLGPKAPICSFFTYPHFWEGFWLQVMILEKVGNFSNLEKMVFGKPPGCTSKLCNRLPAWLCLKREIKGLFLKFWWEACLKLWFFSLEILEKGYFWHQLSLEIHKFGLNSRSTSSCL